jgi:hypothetical protein
MSNQPMPMVPTAECRRLSADAVEASPSTIKSFAMLSTGTQEIVERAKRAGAAEELAGLLLKQALKAFEKSEDATAQALRGASAFVADWGVNERQLQSALEKKHGRYDG